MAGHSKWANIKHRKGKQDKKRAKQFSRAIKEINVAIKENGLNGDPETNATLRNAIQNAKGVNMPKDTIQRAIKKATGAEADSYEKITFEGYGPHGIAMIIECTTDNTNRTVAAVRSIFTKNEGSLGTNGSLEFLFDRKGVFTIDKEHLELDLETLQLQLIEVGATSFDNEHDVFVIYTKFTAFGNMSQKLDDLGIQVKNAELQYIPITTKTLDLDKAKTIISIIETFEEDDDVQDVYHNLEMTEALEAEINSEEE